MDSSFSFWWILFSLVQFSTRRLINEVSDNSSVFLTSCGLRINIVSHSVSAPCFRIVPNNCDYTEALQYAGVLIVTCQREKTDVVQIPPVLEIWSKTED